MRATFLLLALASTPSAQAFVERAADVGLDHRFLSGLDRIGTLPNIVDWVQVGMTAGDLDGDGDLDLVTLGRVAPNHLWLHEGGGYVDATPGSGIESDELDTCAALCDWDRDGDLDLAIGVYDHGEGALPGRGRLLRNGGLAVFDDVTVLSGEFGNGNTLCIQVADIDLDGYSDLYLSEFNATENELWLNTGRGAFREVAAALGADDPGSAHVAGVLDTDGDGLPEIHVGNDWPVSFSSGMKHQLGETLLTQTPSGGFLDVTAGSGLDENISTMGIAWGDVDYDGDPDGYKTQVGPQYLIINHGWPASGVPWTRAESEYGVDQPYIKNPSDPFGLDWGQTVGWGTHFTSLDPDPWVDLVLVCGHVEPQASDKNERNFAWLGTGPGQAHVFRERTEELGLLDFIDDRTLLCADADADGDVDLFFGPPGGNLRYFENRIPREGRGYLTVVPQGTTSAPEAIGASVRWFDPLGLPHTRWPGAEAMTAGQNERAAFFGLGNQASVDLSVAFPSGITVGVPGVAKDTRVEVVEPELFVLDPADGVLNPGDILTVTALAHGADGTPLDASADVKLRIAGMRPVSPVVSLGGNAFRREFRADTASDAGVFGVQASFDGFVPRVRPRVTVTGAVDAAQTIARCLPEAVRAGTLDVVHVEAAPRDAAGLPLGAGSNVTARVGAGSPVPMLDLGDGRYAADFPAPAIAGPYSVFVTVDGTDLGPVTAFECAGAVSAARTELYVETPAHHVAMNPTLWFGLLTPRDAGGRRLGPTANVEVQITPDPTSVPVLVRTDLGPVGQSDGQFVLVLERATPSHPNEAHGSLVVLVDGVQAATTDFMF